MAVRLCVVNCCSGCYWQFTIDIAGVHIETDDAPSKLIHDEEYPVAFQQNGFTPRQVNAPKAIFRVLEQALSDHSPRTTRS